VDRSRKILQLIKIFLTSGDFYFILTLGLYARKKQVRIAYQIKMRMRIRLLFSNGLTRGIPSIRF
jgi:hypothetical protein